MSSARTYNWRSVGTEKYTGLLPISVVEKEVISIPLSKKEILSINEYGEAYFDKGTIDKLPSQYPSSKGLNKRNPNVTGIKGEWAGTRYFENKPNLLSFLAGRPWRMSDMGDCILAGRTVKVFDYKTRTRRASVKELLTDDSYLAEMDAKFAQDKYKYLQGFIFCVNNEEDNNVHLMGWMLRSQFLKHCKLYQAGSPVPHSSRPYDADILGVPYRRLLPMPDLWGLKYHPVSEEMTLAMKKDWKDGTYEVKKYIRGV